MKNPCRIASGLVAGLLLFTAGQPLIAQFGPPRPFSGSGNFALRSLTAGGSLSYEPGWDDGNWQEGWATSSLPAEGPEPSIRKGPYESAWDELGASLPLIEWSMMYAPKRLVDGDPATAWAEGAPGPGVGEVVMVPFDDMPAARIWNGYQKSERLFRRNARVKEAEILLLHGHVIPGQFRSIYRGLTVVGVSRVALRDEMGPQEVALPEHPDLPDYDEDGFPMATVIAIRILSVYPGTHYEDCCISEIGY